MSEMEKFSGAHATLETIRDFLEWCDGQKIELAAWTPHGTRMLPIIEGREGLLMRYLDLDPVKLENERRALLAHFNVTITEEAP